jgi:hypothetical protein
MQAGDRELRDTAQGVLAVEGDLYSSSRTSLVLALLVLVAIV